MALNALFEGSRGAPARTTRPAVTGRGIGGVGVQPHRAAGRAAVPRPFPGRSQAIPRPFPGHSQAIPRHQGTPSPVPGPFRAGAHGRTETLVRERMRTSPPPSWVARASPRGDDAASGAATSAVTVADDVATTSAGPPPNTVAMGTSAPIQDSQDRRILRAINESTKWAVSACAFGFLALKHDVYVAWAILGSILGTVVCKVLKKVINQDRPDGEGAARKSDPGMPSSHANSLAFLGTYSALSILEAYGTGLGPSASAAGISALAVFLTWLRVELGYHTTEQVAVGFVLGTTLASGWHALGVRAALPVLAAPSAWEAGVLYALTGGAVAFFAVKNVASEAQSILSRMRKRMS